MTGDPSGATRPGRPRSDEVGPTLLAVTRRLVVERGYAAVSIGDIARAAGTGRQTIYRRWPGKAELVLAAFIDDAEARVDAAGSGPGDTVANFLWRTFRALDRTGPALRGLMAQAQDDPAFRVHLRDGFIGPRRASLRRLLDAGRSHGSVRTDVDLDTMVSALYGGLWYRLLLDEPLDRRYADDLAQLVAPPRS